MKHGEGVLAAGETEHHLVALLDHVVLTDGFSWGGLEGLLSSRYHITSHQLTSHHNSSQLNSQHITTHHNSSHHITTHQLTSQHNSSQLITTHITSHHIPIDFIIRLGTSGNKSLCFFINFTLSLNSMPGTIAVYSNTPSTPV